ncbi:nitrogen regulation protein NR(II) [Ahrensia sp. R2A130]|uniref:two-component system sensor histidine kinase NtrB n=1 Tax=Ahrensia sp. R2A130 TaxID=744979 RepID=UPI0001E0B45B|nr:ATP-binding protein [Ahrensia sp. R2A130]EFL90136.1 nitrogen regulation protein NtrB [Ahrensia sp. R2A130]
MSDLVETSEALGVMNALPHPVFVVDASGKFHFANTSAEMFFKTSAAVLLARNLDQYLSLASPLRALIEQVLKGRSPVNEYKVDLSSPRLGSERWVDIYVSPMVEEEGRVAVQLQVRSMADTLDRQLTHRGAARTVTGLAAMLAHEIKNPLSGIRGAAQLLETSGTEDDRTLTRLITDETDRIVRLVDRMEVFSDERPVERDPVNIHSVLEHVKKVAESGFGRGVMVEELYDPSLPPVLGNRDQLIQVFLNLVKNACEAMEGREDRVLTLKTAYRPGMRVAAAGSRDRVSLPISLSVGDNGVGIPDDILAHMFDPFVSSKINGSGLGLALVAKIVGDHGGVVSCDRSGKGTRFEILLPVWKEARLTNG